MIWLIYEWVKYILAHLTCDFNVQNKFSILDKEKPPKTAATLYIHSSVGCLSHYFGVR
ncbi:DUF3307 domain-containing protein [Fontibacillus panacisegetis]|uniref:DUF3307 domain-containing protein n=1 Tax=Fontibacillus solani TaxID=1572857 RepID=UPI0035E3FBF2